MRQVKVVKKQVNSDQCFVCGLQNPAGLSAAFYALADGQVAGIFAGGPGHQSYPGRVHGGVIAAMLDETIGRAIMPTQPESWGVTVELTLRYKKPVPVSTPLTVVARVVKDNRRLFEGEGEILLPDGTVAVRAHGRYMKFTMDALMQGAADTGERIYVAPGPEDPPFVWLPDDGPAQGAGE